MPKRNSTSTPTARQRPATPLRRPRRAPGRQHHPGLARQRERPHRPEHQHLPGHLHPPEHRRGHQRQTIKVCLYNNTLKAALQGAFSVAEESVPNNA